MYKNRLLTILVIIPITLTILLIPSIPTLENRAVVDINKKSVVSNTSIENDSLVQSIPNKDDTQFNHTNAKPDDDINRDEDLLTFSNVNEKDESTVISQFGSGFISKWNTSISGLSESDQIILPLVSDGIYNFEVDWGDGTKNTITTYDQTEVTHTYTTEGVYTVNITGTLNGWQFYYSGDADKIIEISQWGDLQLGNDGYYFAGCDNLIITAIDQLNLSNTTNFRYAFRGAPLGAQGDFNLWDTSNITSMDNMFYKSSSFNISIGNWNTSQVTSMNYMFNDAVSFNQPLDNWDVSSVTSMFRMFSGASSFNQSLGTWNTSQVTSMIYMFNDAVSFNQPLDNWDVSSVTKMNYMFSGASSFDRALGAWNTSQVTSMNYMYNNAVSFNQPLDNWDVSSVTNMNYMFNGASSFDRALGAWNTSQVASMNYMFNGAISFNQSLENWDTSKVHSMENMFGEAVSFNGQIGTWNTSNVLDMDYMFHNAISFNNSINDWDTSNVIDMSWMFANATNFNQPLSKWNVSKVFTFQGMFTYASNFNQSLNNWVLRGELFQYTHVDLSMMFMHATSFNQPLDGWHVEYVTDMSKMFAGASSFNQPLNAWGYYTSQVQDMSYMFKDAVSFNQPLDAINIQSVLTMESMFENAYNFNQQLGTWRFGAISSLNHMFSGVTLSPDNYDATLIGWVDRFGSSSSQAWIGISFSGGFSQYTKAAIEARNYLIYELYWDLEDGGRLGELVDNTPPVISNPENVSYSLNSMGNKVIWDVGDNNPDVYNVTLNGLLYIDTTTWVNGTIYIDIDGLSVGEHVVTLSVFDKSENHSINSVFITVTQIDTITKTTTSTKIETTTAISTFTDDREGASNDGNNSPLSYSILILIITIVAIPAITRISKN